MKTVYLHGSLKEQFGGPYEFDIASPREAGLACASQFPGFFEVMRDGKFEVITASSKTGKNFQVGMGEVAFNYGGRYDEIHITPVIEGAGRSGKGIGKIILGIVLVVVAIFVPEVAFAAGEGIFGGAISFQTIGLAGLGIALSGVATLLAPTPQVGDITGRESADERRSFLFSGARNTSEQGQPIPLIYGQMLVGSTVISAGIIVQEMATNVTFTPVLGL